MKTRLVRQTARGIELTWSHFGTLHRAAAWPEVDFASCPSHDWVSYTPDPSSDIFASAAVMIDRTKWNRDLEYVPTREREFVEQFKTGRLMALTVITQCPSLLEELVATPALAPFLAAHVKLRGTFSPRWEEINAVYSRSGLYGILEWLGLPASRQTVTILQKITDVDLPRRLLEPLRASLWEPEIISLLESAPKLTESDLVGRCHALAA
jgi:hypothetical protein